MNSLHPDLPSGRARRSAPSRTLAVLSTVLLPFVAGCSVLARLDYGNLVNRGGWQLTQEVVETLGIRPGDTIADLGAGDGYFAFVFADAVGPEGRVYAIDVDTEKLATLREEVASRGYRNITVIEGTSAESGLPAEAIDLAFFCNAYHHFEDRVQYMQRLREALAPRARVAILDGKSNGGAQLFIPKGHWLEPGQIERELASAGYRSEATYDFLPMQTFDVFTLATAAEHGTTRAAR
jgi:arsenite methyltransferase